MGKEIEPNIVRDFEMRGVHQKLKDSNVLFATFSMWDKGKRMPTNGNVEPLRDFLRKYVRRLVLIDQPVPGSHVVMPIIEEYASEARKNINVNFYNWLKFIQPILLFRNKHGTRLIFKVRDFLSVVGWCVIRKENFDIFVGVESINCLAGIILKKWGYIKTVIYYVLDLAPNRYNNPLVNKIYLMLDKYCAENSDYVWDVSKKFQTIRIENGLNIKKSASVIHVPIGLYDYQIVKTKKEIIGHNLVFVGTLGEENGPDLAIHAFSRVLSKHNDAKLHIVGGGETNLQRLRKLSKKLNIEDRVVFYGYIPSIRKMVDIISKLDVALAPYLELKGSIRYFADSAKIRTYAGAALPIITTNVPPLGSEIAKLGGAIIAKDNETDFANAINNLLSNPDTYKKMRKKVMEFSKENTWNNEFKNAFGAMN